MAAETGSFLKTGRSSALSKKQNINAQIRIRARRNLRGTRYFFRLLYSASINMSGVQ